MPAFASVQGQLSIPSDVHPPDPRYRPVAIGEPLCVEILHWALGDVNDWWGKSEILSASRSKLGGGANPGPRLVHFIRKDIQRFDHIDQLGADQYGHRLVFYTPVYDGRELRLTLQYVELDRAVKKNFENIGGALRQALGSLPIFAAQLPFVANLSSMLELGRKTYNLFNDNDNVLTERLDLRLNDPDFNRLTSGRYVVVGGSHRPDVFVSKYKLATKGPLKNRLTDQQGQSAEPNMASPYFVLRINAKERSEYKDFEIQSAAQEMIEAVLDRQGLDEEVAGLISDAAKAAREYRTVKEIIRHKKQMDQVKENIEKEKIRGEIKNLMKRLSGTEQTALLMDALDLASAVETGSQPAG